MVIVSQVLAVWLDWFTVYGSDVTTNCPPIAGTPNTAITSAASAGITRFARNVLRGLTYLIKRFLRSILLPGSASNLLTSQQRKPDLVGYAKSKSRTVHKLIYDSIRDTLMLSGAPEQVLTIHCKPPASCRASVIL